MNELVLKITKEVFSARCSQITFIINVNLQISINCGCKYIRTNIKLSAMNEQWIVNVLLNDAGPAAIYGRLLYNSLDLIILLCNLNSMTSVGVLTRLDDPNVLGCSWRLVIR